ncbi:PREDICTED: bromodomain-containing protein 4B-like, partial [Bactrocera latifrons]|uniref:bromodomain-containing protein 4B-like n=1 Tax=Bactrocera latifrons TaxID=174628 RepID=UPI0008DDAF18
LFPPWIGNTTSGPDSSINYSPHHQHLPSRLLPPLPPSHQHQHLPFDSHLHHHHTQHALPPNSQSQQLSTANRMMSRIF